MGFGISQATRPKQESLILVVVFDIEKEDGITINDTKINGQSLHVSCP